MVLQMVETHGVKTYNVSAGKTMPEFLKEKRSMRQLKKDLEFRQRIQLIQDLEFNTTAGRIKESPDGEFLCATGVYPPQMRMFELSQLSMKFERTMDSEVVQFLFFSDDYKKLVFLGADRSLGFHAQFGLYHKIRIPKFGRDMVYNPRSCDLFVGAVGSDIYRINLDQGTFLTPLQFSGVGVNATVMNPVHGLLSFGGENGVVECWDPRAPKLCGSVNVGEELRSGHYPECENGTEVTALRHSKDGLYLAAGTASGHVVVYDIRSPIPLFVKDHQYGLPIKNIQFYGDTKRVISSDSKAIKIWDVDNNGRIWNAIETPSDINDVCVVKDSGLIFVCCEEQRIQSYFMPALGPAPRWVPYLDNLTEELEEEKDTTMYDDYKFVTTEELHSLGLSHIIGTNLLRAYMHGFFMDIRLYQKTKAVADPFAYDEYKKQKIKEKIDKKRADRITLLRRLPKVNKDYAAELLLDKKGKKKKARENEDDDQLESAAEKADNPLQDSRFGALFTNPDFKIDKSAEEYKLLNPVENTKKKSALEGLEEYDAVSDDDGTEEESSEHDGSGDDSDEDLRFRNVSKKKKKQLKGIKEEFMKQKNEAIAAKREQARKPRLFELKDGNEASLRLGKSSKTKKKNLEHAPFMDRVQKSEGKERADFRNVAAGGREMTFTPNADKKKRSLAKQQELEHAEMMKQRKRRGVSSLGLKDPSPGGKRFKQ